MAKPSRKAYLVQSVVHAAQILRAFYVNGEVLRLRDVAGRTGFTSTMCFRLLFTLQECGLVEKAGDNSYRLAIGMSRSKRYRFALLSKGLQTSFYQEVLAGLRKEAELQHFDLAVLESNGQPGQLGSELDQLIRDRVDLIFEFQTDESLAPRIATGNAGLATPVIAVDCPHPGASFFGANQHEAGMVAGRWLGRWASRLWTGGADEILMIRSIKDMHLSQARLRGMEEGLHQVHPRSERAATVYLDCDGQFHTALDRIGRHLAETRARHLLVAAASSATTLAAVKALERAGRQEDCAVVGQDADRNIRSEMRNEKTSLVGCISFFPEAYGEGLVRMAQEILTGRPRPSAIYTRHHLITPENVDHFYPNDTLS